MSFSNGIISTDRRADNVDDVIHTVTIDGRTNNR